MTGPAALFGFDPPELPPDAAAAIAAEHWGVTGSPHRVRGERSNNTVLTHPDGRAWTLQVQSASEQPSVIDLQTRAMQHLERSAPDVPVSRVVPTVAGAVHAEVDIAGRSHLARLVTFLPGTTFDPSSPLPDEAYRRIGGVVGRIAAGLTDFDHPAAAHFMPWDIANGLVVDPAMRRELGPSSVAVLEQVDDRLHAAVEAMGALPRRTIHNDGHAYNLLRPDATSHQVSGVIDFGDVVHTVTAADVAVVAESFAPDHVRPADVVTEVTAGYHAELPLTEDEVAAIPELVLVRIALTVLLVEHQIRHAPHLAPGAVASLPDVVGRLVRWNGLDAGAMVARIRAALTTSPASADPTGPGSGASA